MPPSGQRTQYYTKASAHLFAEQDLEPEAPADAVMWGPRGVSLHRHAQVTVPDKGASGS